MANPRMAVVISHVIQHFAPVYMELAKSAKIDLKVFFIAENGAASYPDPGFGEQVKWDLELTTGYQHEFVDPGKVINEFSFFAIDSPNLMPAIKRFGPDYVWLHGYAALANWRVLLGFSNAAKFIYSSDSNPSGERSTLRRFLKQIFVRFFLGRCQYCLSISPANRKYLETYGARKGSVVKSKFPIDIDRLKSARDNLTASQINNIRDDLSIPKAAKIILFAGKLIAHKRPQDVLSVLLEPDLEKVHAILLGGGEMQRSLQRQAEQLDIQNRVHLVGFVNQSELAKYFALADVLLFPSAKEPYGAIAAETLPFGLPIVATDVIGAIGESIIPDVNALLYPVADVVCLGQQLRRLIQDEELRMKYSRNCVDLADAHDKGVMARDIIGICLK